MASQRDEAIDRYKQAEALSEAIEKALIDGKADAFSAVMAVQIIDQKHKESGPATYALAEKTVKMMRGQSAITDRFHPSN